MMEGKNILNHVASIAQSVSVKSALNPLLWLCAILGLPSLFFGFYSHGGAQIFFFVITGVLVFAVILAFAFFALKSPSNLRSEEYNLRHQALTMLGDKDNSLRATAEDVERITNPMLPPPKQINKQEEV